MNIEGDNLICACLQGISQSLHRGSSHESNVKYMSTLESLFRTWFGASIEDEYRKWCEHLNHGRGIHADLFDESSAFVFRDRSFWKASALDYLHGHIEKNIRKKISSNTSKASVEISAAAVNTGFISARSLLVKECKEGFRDEVVAFRSVDARALHSGYPTCVSAGPPLPGGRHLIAIAFEDLTMQILEYTLNKDEQHTVKVLSTTRFAPPKPISVFKMEIEVGSRVLTSPEFQNSEDADDGPLRPGNVGVVDIKDESSLPFRVEYEGRTYWYSRNALVPEKKHALYYVPVVSCTSDTIFCSSIVSFEEGQSIQFVGQSFGGLREQAYFVHRIASDRLSFSISLNRRDPKPIDDLRGEPASAYVRPAESPPFIQWAPTNIPILSRDTDFVLISPMNPRVQDDAAVFFTDCTVPGIKNGSTYFLHSVLATPGEHTLKFSIKDSNGQPVNVSRVSSLGTIRLQSHFYVAAKISDCVHMCSYSWSPKQSKTPWESKCVNAYLSVKSCCLESADIKRFDVQKDIANNTFTCCAWGHSLFACASLDGTIHVCSFDSPENFRIEVCDLSIDL